MTTNPLGNFPFGFPLRPVAHADCSPRRVFVLGVYASAVHARWVGPDGRTRVAALAVASEPEIFWRGDGAAEIVAAIELPRAAGRLFPAPASLNGPSGRSLDERVLAPLGLTRADVWLCDLVPHCCLNERQQAAIDREYVPRMGNLGLPPVNLPGVPSVFADDQRREQVLTELEESQADLVVLLGDQPIRHWLHAFDPRWQRLSDFGAYGRLHEIFLHGRRLRVLPLAHVRQTGALGAHSRRWFDAHSKWERESAAGLLQR